MPISQETHIKSDDTAESFFSPVSIDKGLFPANPERILRREIFINISLADRRPACICYIS